MNSEKKIQENELFFRQFSLCFEPLLKIIHAFNMMIPSLATEKKGFNILKKDMNTCRYDVHKW